MRLKDADEIKETIRRTKLVQWQKAVIWALIDMHKTVDAVPIEFIRSEIKNSKGFYNSSLRRLLDAWEERKEE